MDKLYHIQEPFFTEPQDVPKPPVREEFVNYDPKIEPPKWDWARMRFSTVPREKIPDRPRTGGVPDSDDKPDWRGVVRSNVIPLEAQKAYDFGQPEYRKYYFFDTPDYADPFKKLWFSFKVLLKTGALLSCSVAIMKGMNPCMASYKYLLMKWYAPWMIGGMTCSTSVVTVANLRGKKDDYLNYVAAGPLAAWANCRGNWIRHMNYTIYWTLAAVTVKYVNEQNLVLLPIMNQGIRSLGLHGNSAEDGLVSGNLHIVSGMAEDGGRDTRRHAY